MVACHARAEKSKEGTTRLLAILRSAEWRPEDFVGSIFCFCGERELEKEGSFTSSLAKWAKRRERRRPTVPPARTRCVSISVSTPQECVAVQVPFRRFQRYGLFLSVHTHLTCAVLSRHAVEGGRLTHTVVCAVYSRADSVQGAMARSPTPWPAPAWTQSTLCRSCVVSPIHSVECCMPMRRALRSTKR